MRNLILMTAILVGCGGGTSGNPDADVTVLSDGPHGDGSPLDGHAPFDALGVSYAPCDTCCDPIAQNCPTGQACYENGTSNGTYCDAVGVFPTNHGCDSGPDPNNHCVAGDTCFAINGNTACLAFCLSNADCTSAAHPTCVLYTVTAGHNAYGICF